MRALVLVSPMNLEIHEIDEPIPQPGEVVVEVELAGVCGSDLHDLSGKGIRKIPSILGHEAVCRDELGRRLVLNPVIPCFECVACNSGRSNLCRNRIVVGINRPGAFAERMAVPEFCLHELPSELHSESAILIEPLANALHAFSLMPIGKDSKVAILGAGAIGLSVALTASHLGFKSISIAEPLEFRRAFAETLDVVVYKELIGEYDLIFDCVGSGQSRVTAIECLKPGGVSVWLGLQSADAAIDFKDLVRQEKSIVGSYAYTNSEFSNAIFLASNLQVNFIQVFAFEDAPKVFLDLQSGSIKTVKALLRP